MTASLTTPSRKSALRKTMKLRRNALASRNSSPDLTRFFARLPHEASGAAIIAGFAPIQNEIDIWPLLKALQIEGRSIALPVVIGAEAPLVFREWTPDCEMATDRYGVPYPTSGKTLTPALVLLPLLAFTSRGDRIGYGGGYYDRTLAALRSGSAVFACGVGYAGQEVAELPTDAHDAKLDGILTENGFQRFE